MNKEGKEIKEEIRKEFQLERMILFSDAVFAIVITLMAIEIRMPFKAERISFDTLVSELLHLIPSLLAYTASFAFIGQIWYQHLKVFGLLKDYDKGLVIRNLLMLFFIGLFPFSVTLITQPSEFYYLQASIYFLIIIFCKFSQLNLQHYILVKRPNLRIHAGIHEEVIRFKKSRLAVVLLTIAASLTTATMLLIPNPNLRHLAWWWFFPFPLVLKFFQKKIK